MNKIKKENWVSKFNLLGEVHLNDNTFQMNKVSDSGWKYSRMNLCIKCGSTSGNIYTEMMGGFNSDGSSVIYAHGKTDDGRDDFSQKVEVPWENREDAATLESIGDMCFIQIGLEKTESGKVFYQKFLSEYDAIAYLNDHLHDGDKVYVSGTLKYSVYNGTTQVKKAINKITIYTPRSDDEEFKPYARFTQSVLLNNCSASLKEVNKESGTMPVNARVLDYVKEIDGVLIKGQYPFSMSFEYKLDLTNETLCKAIYKKLFEVKSGWTQITFNGEFVESGAAVNVTLDDVSDDIKELIKAGIYTEEEVLRSVVGNGNRERKMVLLKPIIITLGNDDNKISTVAKFENRYSDEDLEIDLGVSESDFDNATPIEDGDEMDWLNLV